MGSSKVSKLILDGNGSYLGMEKGCFIVKDKHDNTKRYPLFEKEIGEVILKSGNAVSTGALASLGFWDIDVMIMTQRGRPVAMLKSFDDDSHVKTRINQYDAFRERRLEIAPKFVIGKIKGQNQLLKKYGLKRHGYSWIEKIKRATSIGKLLMLEGKCTKSYFNQIFGLFVMSLRPEKRIKFRAYDGLNNVFNLAYELLKWKIHIALVNAKLEPFLGFLHSLEYSKPSLVCDFQELYRYLIDDFVIEFCRTLRKRDFRMKTADFSSKKKGKREYLDDMKTKELVQSLNMYFKRKIEIPRIKHGKQQEIETLISEEAMLFAKFLRGERKSWIPRICL